MSRDVVVFGLDREGAEMLADAAQVGLDGADGVGGIDPVRVAAGEKALKRMRETLGQAPAVVWTGIGRVSHGGVPLGVVKVNGAVLPRRIGRHQAREIADALDVELVDSETR